MKTGQSENTFLNEKLRNYCTAQKVETLLENYNKKNLESNLNCCNVFINVINEISIGFRLEFIVNVLFSMDVNVIVIMVEGKNETATSSLSIC